MSKKAKKKLSTKDIIELLIKAVIAVATLITAIKSQQTARGWGESPEPFALSQHSVWNKAMKNINNVTTMLVLILVMAQFAGWGIAWKIIVGACAVYDLVLIALKFWEHRK